MGKIPIVGILIDLLWVSPTGGEKGPDGRYADEVDPYAQNPDAVEGDHPALPKEEWHPPMALPEEGAPPSIARPPEQVDPVTASKKKGGDTPAEPDTSTPAKPVTPPKAPPPAKPATPEPEKKPKPSSPGRMNEEVKKEQAPKEIVRVDRGHVDDQEPHVHYGDGTSSTESGNVHDAHKGTPNPSKKARKWLEKHKWTPPPRKK